MRKNNLYAGVIQELKSELKDFCVKNQEIIQPVKGHPEFTFIIKDKKLAFYYYKFCENLSNINAIKKVNKGLNFVKEDGLTTLIDKLRKRAEFYDSNPKFDSDEGINHLLDYGVMNYF